VSFRFVAAERAQHPVSLLCKAVGVTRQGFYAWQRRALSARDQADAVLSVQIADIHEQSLETYGAPRIHAELALGRGIRVGRKRVARLMRSLGVEGVSRRRGRRSTTTRDERAVPADDLVGRRFTAAAPDRLWLADITYIPTHEGWLYLAGVVDAFSRRCVGWSMSETLHSDLVLDAISMAVTRRRPKPGVVHHSDRGSQYTSIAFGQRLREAGITASMGRRGDCYDNAVAESFWSTIKGELIHRRGPFASRDAARLAVFHYIEAFYNPLRRHSTLGYLSPNEYETVYWTNHPEQETSAA
jgi:putative transposase